MSHAPSLPLGFVACATVLALPAACSSGSPATVDVSLPAGVCAAPPRIQGDLRPSWSLALGATNDPTANRMRVDRDGKVFVSGTFKSRLSVGNRTLTGSTMENPFLLALGPDGRLAWMRSFEGAGLDDFDLTPDGGFAIVRGLETWQTADYGGGALAGPVVVAKLDRNGHAVWSRRVEAFPATQSSQSSRGPWMLAAGPAGELAILGGVDLGTDVGFQYYVAELDAAGNLLWSHEVLAPDIQTTSVVTTYGIAFDAAGNVVAAGQTWTEAYAFGPRTTTTWLEKRDGAGNLLWSRTFDAGVTLSALATDGARTLVAGNFTGTLTLYGSTTTARGSGDIFVAAVDEAAPPASTATLLATFEALGDPLQALAPDGQGGVVAAGGITHYLDLGAGTLPARALAVVRLDGSGRTLASAALDTPLSAVGRSIAVDGSGGIALFGTFAGAIDLGTGVLPGTAGSLDGGGSYPEDDLFVAKLTAAPASPAPPRPCPPPAGEVLAGGLWIPSWIALAGDTLVFSTGSEVGSVPVAGGAPKILATLQQAVGLVVDGDTIFWANADGSIVSLPLAGGTPTVLASGQPTPVAIAVDAGNVYWTGGGAVTDTTGAVVALEGSLRAVARTGGTPQILASGMGTMGPVATGGGSVVFAGGNTQFTSPFLATPPPVPYATQIIALPPSGAPITLAATAHLVSSMAADATTAAWSEQGVPTVEGLANDGAVRSAPLAGGAVALLADAEPDPTGIVLADGQVYWVDNEGGPWAASQPHIWRMPAGGGAATSLVEAGQIVTFSVDSARLAWIARDANGYSWALRLRTP